MPASRSGGRWRGPHDLGKGRTSTLRIGDVYWSRHVKPLDITLATFEPEVAQSSGRDGLLGHGVALRNLAPILDNLAAEYAGRVKVVEVDVDAEQALAQAFQFAAFRPSRWCGG